MVSRQGLTVWRVCVRAFLLCATSALALLGAFFVALYCGWLARLICAGWHAAGW